MGEVKLTLGDPMADEQIEALRDGFDADQAAGDADWRDGATYVYGVEQATEVDGVLIPAGVYLRHIVGGAGWAWPVLGGDVGAYVEAIEQRFLAEQDGAKRKPGCQGEWD